MPPEIETESESDDDHGHLNDYRPCLVNGKQQADHLNALDFMDQLTPGMKVFNVCRPRT